MKRRSIFKSLIALLFAKKVAASLKDETGTGTIKWIPVLSPPEDADGSDVLSACDEWLRRADLPILHFIGTGDEPSVGGEFRMICRSGPGDSEESVIAKLIGYSGIHIVHLFGEWEKVIRRETFLNCWRCNLCRNEVKPRLFINGTECFVINGKIYFFYIDPLMP